MMAKTYLANSTTSLRGFTLVELVVVIVMLAILSVYGIANNLDSAEMTLPSQAERLASDIRLAQSLAFTSGSRVQVTSSTSGYSVTCVPTCNNTYDFSVTLKKGVTMTASTVVFTTNGAPATAPTTPTFTLTAGSSTKSVNVTATGHVSVTP